MPLYVVAAAFALALSVPVLWFTLAGNRVDHGRVNDNLLSGLVSGADTRTLALSRPWAERVVQPLLRLLTHAARRVSPAGMVDSLARSIWISGVRWPVERLLVVKLALSGALLGTGLAWAATGFSAARIFAVVALGAAGYLGPDALLARLARARQLRIANELPDTLDQLTICVEAGLGFDAALARSAKAGNGPLAEEIGRLLQDFRVGVPRSEALAGMLARTDVAELHQFVNAVIQAETYGVPISRMLRSQAAEQREKRRFRAEERAMKLPVKVIFPLVFCILPVLFILIVGPAFVRLVHGLN